MVSVCTFFLKCITYICIKYMNCIKIGLLKTFYFVRIVSKMAAKAYIYLLNICTWYMVNFAEHIRYIWLQFYMWVVNIISNIFYSFECDVLWSSKKIMGVISEKNGKSSKFALFQRAVTLFISVRSLPNLACDFILVSVSIFVLYHI